MDDAFASLRQPQATSGVKIEEPLVLAQILEIIDSCQRWELSYITQVWFEGNERRLADPSWGDTPFELDDATLRTEAQDAQQVINGRFTGFVGDREVVMIEAVDSSFWLIWSDDERLRQELKRRFPNALAVVPPSEFHPHG